MGIGGKDGKWMLWGWGWGEWGWENREVMGVDVRGNGCVFVGFGCGLGRLGVE